jgi:Tfp pilus assembly protein PilN
MTAKVLQITGLSRTLHAVNLRPVKVAVALLGDRLAVAVLSGSRVEAFTVDAESPAVALRAELDSRHLPARSASLGVTRSSVSVKQIELPPVAGDTHEMVGFELERHLPFPAEDATFDFVLLPPEPAGERPAAAGQRVLITAADRRVVDAALRLAEEAHLRPLSLTVAAHNLPVLARRLHRNRRVVWVHRVGDAVDLLLLQGDSLLLSRSLPSSDDAAIAEEIQRSIAAARWRDCNAIWLSGDDPPDGLTSPPLMALGVPVTEPGWTPLARQRLAAIEAEHRGALQLAVALVSARGVRPLELLPTAIRPRRLTRPQIITACMAGATALLAILALLAPGWREQRHLKHVNAEITRLEPTAKEADRVMRELERKRKVISTVDGIESAAIRPLPVLRDLTELLPNDAWLTTVSLDSKGVELTGAAAAASTLIPLLENSPRLERVEFSSPVTRGRDSKEQFRIRAVWEVGGAGAGAASAAAASPAGASAVAPLAPGAPGAATGVPAPPRRALPPGAVR